MYGRNFNLKGFSDIAMLSKFFVAQILSRYPESNTSLFALVMLLTLPPQFDPFELFKNIV
jgi:hypothetical protein